VRPTARPPDLRQRPDTVAEALAALEKGLAGRFKEQGVKVEGRE
jgi:hypothetical protein